MASQRPLKSFSILPGFAPTLAWTLVYSSLVVLIPLATLVLRAAGIGPAELWAHVTTPRALAALRLSAETALLAASINGVIGFVVAWALSRYEFPGRRALDALVDLPFALPTAVSGIALTALLSPRGWLGAWLTPLGLELVFTKAGIVFALVFIGLPFVVRTVQPALEELDPSVEEAAAALGASFATTFCRVLLPTLVPALLTGIAMAFARAVGEYGSVIFIAGNMPLRTEIAPLLVVIQLEQFDENGAIAIGTALLVVSFAMLMLINLLQRWSQRQLGGQPS
jgi:sulfate transport system permease protein